MKNKIIISIMFFVIGITALFFTLNNRISIEEGYTKKSPDLKWEFSTQTGYNKKENKYYVIYTLKEKGSKKFYLEYPLEQGIAVSARESTLEWDKDSATVTSTVPCYNDGIMTPRIQFKINVLNNKYEINKIKDL